MDNKERFIRNYKQGITWRKPVPCPECNKEAYLTSINIPYVNIKDWKESVDIYCPRCGYPHREKNEYENPDKPKI